MTTPAHIEAAAALADEQMQQLTAPATQQDTPPQSQGQQVEVQQAQAVDEVTKLRNRYNSLQGKYDAEVPRLSKTVKDYEARMKALEEENSRLREAADKATVDESTLTDSDVDTYGEDMVNMVRRGAKEYVAPLSREAAQLRMEMDRLKAQLSENEASRAQQAQIDFTNALDAVVPAWRDQNEDPEFLEWLKQPIPGYGISRQTALDNAVNVLDANRVISVFTSYLQEKQVRANNTLGRQVAPTHVRGSVAPQQQSGRVWTSAMIEQFYAAVRRHEVPEAEIAKIESEIDAAVASGQVIA